MSATPGRSIQRRSRGRSRAALAASACVLLTAVAHAAVPAPSLAIPAGPLDGALATLATQAGIDVGGAVDGLDAVRVRGLRGRIAPAAALRRLLAGTPYAAETTGGGGYRIVRRPAVRRPPPPAPRAAPARPPPPPPPPPTEVGPVDIVVVASKREAGLFRFPGSAGSYPLDPFGGRPGAATDLTALADALPVLQATDFGAGRDKIFVRGVADSSFNGPTQSVTGLYFGDVQVGYGGPDPGLDLFDVDRIEVLEGPQGTLYGAGAIGGVIALTPNAPALDRIAGTVQAGITATQSGAAGYDAAAMLNLPLAEDRLGARLVAYRRSDGGYIDDLRRGARNVNRTTIEGGRAALRASAGDWTVDLSALLQGIDGRDAQYAERGLPGEARRSLLAQPFSDRFLLGRLVVSRRWDSGLRLVSATGWVARSRDEAFDASPLMGGPDRPVLYRVASDNQLFTHETRLSRSLPGGVSWVVGAALLYDREQFSRRLGPPGNPIDINGVTNRTVSVAVFGEATLPVTRRLALTAGARASRARTDGDPTTATRNTVFVHGRISERVDPMAGADLLLTRDLALYARYQSGYRTGGLAVARNIGRVADFTADTIGVVEGGLRLRRRGSRGLSGTIALSHASWDNIQADLVNARGLPYTSNIGRGVIDGLEATVDWVPAPGLHVTAAAFLARSRLEDPVATLEAERGSALPNVPRLAVGGDASYRLAPAPGQTLTLFAGAHYRGHSVLGTGPLLGVRQGGYVDQSLGATWGFGRWQVTARLDNPLDSNGERFALGNPFQLAQREQYTPLRPRNLRVAAAYSW